MPFSSIPLVVISASALLALGLMAFVLHCNRRAPANRWLALGLFVIAVHQALVLISRFVVTDPLRMALLRVAFGVTAALPSAWLGFSLTFGEKNGGYRASRWYLILPCIALTGFATSVPLWFGKGLHLISINAGGHLVIALDAWGKLLFSVYLVALVLVLLHLENIYRNAPPSLRPKLTTLALGLFFALGCQIVAASYTLLFSIIHPSYALVMTTGFLGGQALIAFAVVRHRLLDTNIYISRHVVYGSLTLALVGGYLLSLGIAAEVFTYLKISLDFLTGTLLAIAGGVALTLLLLSETVRWKVKGFIQAHFYRHKYDYREEWMEFTRLLSHATTTSALAEQTVMRILQIMWVQQVAIYATSGLPGNMKLLHQVGYHNLPSTLVVSPEALRILSNKGNQLPSVGRTEAFPENRCEFLFDISPEVRIEHLVPLFALDALVGLLLVGPEVSGKPFTVDDKDLLAAVAAQAGAMIVNAQLAQDAAEGRELQALARLSAFIAHDLKNAVGMLSLLAENAPHHIHNPEFQTDAIRTLTEVTARMQRLLTALRSSNHQPAASTVRVVGFASTVETWLRDFKAQIPARIILEASLEPTPDVVMDPAQLHTVLVNLFMNAMDAISGDGRITVETHGDESWATLVVRDTGRGMSTDFIRDRLFRPFQTTKPQGLGIGLFQCRHIIQSLGGEITVDSHEGVGTRMIVRLPAASSQEEQVAAGSGQLAED